MSLFETIQTQPKPFGAPLMGYPGIQLTGDTMRDVILSPSKQFDALKALVDRFNPPAIFPLMDLTVEAGGLGLEVEFPEDDVAYVKKHPLREGDDLSGLKAHDLLSETRVKNYLQVVEALARELKGLHGGYVIGPLSLAGLLMGVENLALALLDNALFVRELLLILSEKLARVARAEAAAGADLIAILEPTAMIISPLQFDVFVKPAVQYIIQDLEAMSLLHICGHAGHLVEHMAQTGVDGLSLDYQVDLAKAGELVPSEVVIWGNLNPVDVFLKGTPDSVKKQVNSLLAKMETFDNFALSSGCDLPARTPLENIQAFFEAVSEWKQVETRQLEKVRL
ncbi:MAG: methylcobamide--CoM methyltransferase [Calditrichaeota bacterium]|nr:methylcobamide--CoM methyltransferase [Calditrichota bacterium]